METKREATEMVTFRPIQPAFPVSRLLTLAGTPENSCFVCFLTFAHQRDVSYTWTTQQDSLWDLLPSPVECEDGAENAVALLTAALI